MKTQIIDQNTLISVSFIFWIAGAGYTLARIERAITDVATVSNQVAVMQSAVYDLQHKVSQLKGKKPNAND